MVLHTITFNTVKSVLRDYNDRPPVIKDHTQGCQKDKTFQCSVKVKLLSWGIYSGNFLLYTT